MREGRTPSAADHDPFAPIEVSPRGGAALSAAAVVCAVAALIGGAAPVAGPVGMALGLIAHVKGHRAGLPVAVLAGVAMVAGFSITFLLR